MFCKRLVLTWSHDEQDKNCRSGTLSDLHRQPIHYDLAELERIVDAVQPDLLGVEVERSEFERNDLARAPIEVREALVPLARRSAIVLAPIGSPSPDELRAPKTGLRSGLTRALDDTLGFIQKTANDARRVNSTFISHTCGMICHLEENMLVGKKGAPPGKARTSACSRTSRFSLVPTQGRAFSWPCSAGASTGSNQTENARRCGCSELLGALG